MKRLSPAIQQDIRHYIDAAKNVRLNLNLGSFNTANNFSYQCVPIKLEDLANPGNNSFTEFLIGLGAAIVKKIYYNGNTNHYNVDYLVNSLRRGPCQYDNNPLLLAESPTLDDLQHLKKHDRGYYSGLETHKKFNSDMGGHLLAEDILDEDFLTGKLIPENVWLEVSFSKNFAPDGPVSKWDSHNYFAVFDGDGEDYFSNDCLIIPLDTKNFFVADTSGYYSFFHVETKLDVNRDVIRYTVTICNNQRVKY